MSVNSFYFVVGRGHVNVCEFMYASLNGLWFSRGLLHMFVAGFLVLCVASDRARGPLGLRILAWLLVG